MPLDVLVVDNHADTLGAMRCMMAMWGHACAVADSAAAALALAAARRFDVLLCDYQLDDGTCCDVLAAIRARYPIHGVAITGHGDDARRQVALDAGYADYLTKPLSPEVLKEILDAVDAQRDAAHP
jgi:CheY-like chemotaxis protein